MPRVIQPSFAGGELTPALEGRIDLDKYRTSVAEAENFVIRKFGGASFRTGFALIGPASGATWVVADGPVYGSYTANQMPNTVLIPFQFSDTDTYMLCFCANPAGSSLLMTVIKNGAFVTSGASRYALASTDMGIYTGNVWWGTASTQGPLRNVRYCQDGDTLYLTFPGAATSVSPPSIVMTVTRTSDTAWTFGGFSYTVPVKPAGIVAESYFHGVGGAAPAPIVTATSITRTAKAKYGVTALDAFGNESEMRESTDVEYDTQWPAGYHVRVGWTVPASGTPVRYNVYKNSRGYWGFIGAVDAADVTSSLVVLATAPAFIDDRIEENAAEGPPTWPTDGPYYVSGLAAPENWPTAIAIHEQRLFTANATGDTAGGYPNTVFASQTGGFENHSTHFPLLPTDSIEVTLASGQINPIQHLVSLDELIVLTLGDEWTLGRGRNTDGITPTSVQFRRIGSSGSSEVRPIVIGNAVVFVRADGRSVTELAYSVDADGLASRDLTLLAPHLFEGRRILSTAYQDSPDRTLWVVLDDGTISQDTADWATWVPNRSNLVSLTYEPSQDVWAWSRHQLAHEVYSTPVANGHDMFRLVPICVASVKEMNKDALYLTARLDIINKVASVSAYKSTVVVLRLADRSITEWGENLATPLDAIDLHMDLGLLVTDPVASGGGRSGVAFDTKLLYKDLLSSSWFNCDEDELFTTVVDGTVLATDPGYNSTTGELDNVAPNFQVIMGIPYTGTLKSLPLVAADDRGSPAIGDRQRVVKLVIRAQNTKGATAGPSEDDQVTVDWAGPEAVTGPNTGDFPVALTEKRTRQPRFVIQQALPYPCNILAVATEVEVGR